MFLNVAILNIAANSHFSTGSGILMFSEFRHFFLQSSPLFDPEASGSINPIGGRLCRGSSHTAKVSSYI